ncbi:hypothetical protein B296_00053478 [Ensete ventricosum]|uniref:Uncharacterized protein n=1 Tax=Ensete ventricosum TaxID=4639 RepID=A0A426X4J4_ENSVE|nr:hypothetical protein B296_00053478 [Ensete ventricosum]
MPPLRTSNSGIKAKPSRGQDPCKGATGYDEGQLEREASGTRKGRQHAGAAVACGQKLYPRAKLLAARRP